MGDLRAKEASALIAERCCEPGLRAEQIAEAVGVSPEYLRKLLHAGYGCGFRAARRRARVRVAVTELENTFARMKEIATKLGTRPRVSSTGISKRNTASVLANTGAAFCLLAEPPAHVSGHAGFVRQAEGPPNFPLQIFFVAGLVAVVSPENFPL